MDSYPPLLGDENGRYRVCVIGNCGSGKSTTASSLAKILGVPCLSLDTFFWQPGWNKTPKDEMSDNVFAALESEECKNGWVVDGNYEKRMGEVVQGMATDVIWLDPPLALSLPRIILRTILGIIRVAPPCSPGCPETISKAFFSKKSIIWWCITNHQIVRTRNEAKMERIGLGVGRDIIGRKMRRIGGWGGEYKMWMRGVREMMERKDE